jgi:hypothetical protein
MGYTEQYNEKLMSAKELMKFVKSGMHVHADISLSVLYSGVPLVTITSTGTASNSANVSIPEGTDELEDFDPDDLEKLLDNSDLIETLLEITKMNRYESVEDSFASSDSYYGDSYDDYDSYYGDSYDDYNSSYGDYNYDYGADDYYDVPSYDYAY